MTNRKVTVKDNKDVHNVVSEQRTLNFL